MTAARCWPVGLVQDNAQDWGTGLGEHATLLESGHSAEKDCDEREAQGRGAGYQLFSEGRQPEACSLERRGRLFRARGRQLSADCDRGSTLGPRCARPG